MSKFASALSLAGLTTALAPSAHADLITWSPPQDIVAATDVRLDGTLVTARNPWGMAPASPTVNGVFFPAFEPAGWTNGGWTLMAGSTSGDAGLDALLDSARATNESVANPTGWGGIRLDTLGTLTVGREYLIQVWYCDQRAGVPSNVLNDRVMTLSSATGAATLVGGVVTNLGALTQGSSSLGLEADPNNVAGVGDTIFGQFAVGSFTRTSTDQLWLLIQGTHPLPSNVLLSHINAFQIRELPSNPGVAYCFGDGSGTPCPCMPAPLVGDADKGCPNSFNAGGGKLTASGLASLGFDTLVMTCTTINNGGAVIFQGTNDNGGGLGTAFGDGLRCAGGTVRRMRSHTVTTNTHKYPDPMFGDNAISIRGAVLAPGDRWYQGWYRSGLAHCNPTQNYNLTNGVKVTWAP